MYKFSFVILHYCTIEDTFKSIDSILKLNCKYKIDIVVVDNNSPNNTGEILKQKYSEFDNIHIIINKENLGFARGNNVGFLYAKNELEADFIVMINNDVYIMNNDFCDLIIKKYEKYNFAVLGPKIILRDNSICYYREKLPTIREEKRIILKIIVRYLIYFLYLDKIFNMFYKRNKKSDNKNYKNNNIDVILHGSCLIFSRNYIDKFDGIDDRTFLYCEEELLYLRLKRNGLLSVYDNELEVFHNEDSSTNYITKTERRKSLFKDKQLLKSNRILLEELKKEGEAVEN